MVTSGHLSFGVKTAPQNTTFEDIVRVWVEADATPGIGHAWLFDHFIPLGPDPTGPCLEGWSLLAALAARTERVRVGLMVTGNTYRHPAVLANIGATVDIVSGGRLDFGIGAGWNEQEHAMYGMPLYTPGERIRRLGEACDAIKLLWTVPRANYDGRYYRLDDALCEPKPLQKPYPPFVIGGGGEKLTLRIVAAHADVWNYAGGPLEGFAHKNRVLDEHCAAVGRDPAAIQRSVQIRVDPADVPSALETVRGFVAAGATHIILNLTAPYPVGIVTRLAQEVIEPVTAEYTR